MKSRRAQIPGTTADYPRANQGVSVIDKMRLLLAIRAILNNPERYTLMKSWKTTLFGTGGIGFIIFDAIAKLADGDAATNPDWGLIVGAILPAIGLLFARDNNRTSEQVGAK